VQQADQLAGVAATDPLVVYLDPGRAAGGSGAYVNFFLRVAGCGPPRRVVDYGPFADAAYWLEDLEPEPVAPPHGRVWSGSCGTAQRI
jgi:hypothetical protein